MAVSITNTCSPLYHNTTHRLSQMFLSKPLSVHFKAIRKSASSSDVFTTCCSNSDAAKYLIKDKEAPIELSYEAFPTIMDIKEICEILPHRFPFLFVDSVVEFTRGGVSVVGIKNFTFNENFLSAHFPGKPIVPGVILIEAMAQLGGLIPELRGFKSVYLVGIDKVQFKKQVAAGDTVVMRTTIIKMQKKMGIAKLDAKAYVGGELVVKGELLVYISKASY